MNCSTCDGCGWPRRGDESSTVCSHHPLIRVPACPQSTAMASWHSATATITLTSTDQVQLTASFVSDEQLPPVSASGCLAAAAGPPKATARRLTGAIGRVFGAGEWRSRVRLTGASAAAAARLGDS